MSDKYSKPPIFDAVIEVRLESPIDDALFQKLRKSTLGRYPHVEDEIEFEFKIETVGSQSLTGKLAGAIFKSADAADILILRKNTIVVGRGAPYVGWTAFKARALDEIRRWIKIIGGRRKIARLGVRYQNRIDVPETTKGRFSPHPFVTVLPTPPAILQGQTQAFSMQLAGCKVEDYLVNLHIGHMPSPLINHAAILVDIDAYSDSISNHEDLLDKIERVREVKNAVFEGVITDTARALFK